TNVPANLSVVTAIAAGQFHSLALKADGTVVAWGAGKPGGSGSEDYGQSTVPPALHGAVAIAAGYNHSLAVTPEWNIAAWGYNASGQTNVPSSITNVIPIA